MKNSRLISTFYHNFRLNPRTGLFEMPGYYSMKQKENTQETSQVQKFRIVHTKSDERLIFFQCNLCNIEFSSSDKLIEIRKKRHEEWHDGSQSNKHASQNKVWGKVIWKKLLVITNKKKSGVKQ